MKAAGGPDRTAAPMSQVPLISGFGRLPRHAGALVVCGLALLLAVAVADDYGVWIDTANQRTIGKATLRYLAGESGLNQLQHPWDRLYGPVLEVPLALLEQTFWPRQGRGLYLTRYLLTHLLFVVAGYAGYLLAYRLFGSRLLALFALLLFLLHPRIYAQSFFNSKDVPFLSLFMICLWLAHRAFGARALQVRASTALLPRSGSVASPVASSLCGVLCGVVAGLATNVRIAGLVFVALIFFMRMGDAIGADNWHERWRIVAGGLLFALTAAVTFYVTMPYLWADPLGRFMEIATVFSAFTHDPLQLFEGELVYGSALPWSYLPVWFGITTPPLALILGAVGFGALTWRAVAGLSSPGASKIPLRNSSLRFELLVAACFVVPVLVAIVLKPTLYNGWRHFYFLWAPFTLLATAGLKALIGWLRLVRVPATLVGGLAALGLGATAYEMARLHPHQHLYFSDFSNFNRLTNRPSTAAPLRQRYWLTDEFGSKQGLAHILEELAPDEPVDEKTPEVVFNIRRHASPFPPSLHSPPSKKSARRSNVKVGGPPTGGLELSSQRDRRRFKFDPNADPDFYVSQRSYYPEPHDPLDAPFPPVLYERKLYGQVIAQVTTPDLRRVDEHTANTYRTLYRNVTAEAPAFGGAVDIYRGDNAITWVKAPCAPGDLHDAMDMIIVPLDAAQDRHTRRADGVRVGDACLWQAPLPDTPFAKVLFPHIGALATDVHIEERRHRYARLAATPPTARSTFDVYLQDGSLFYLKTPCVQEDTEASFFVHVRPTHLNDIPGRRRRHGFDTLDFRFGGFDLHWHYASGDIFDGVCLAELELPEYAFASIATGQYAPGGDGLWRVEIGGA